MGLQQALDPLGIAPLQRTLRAFAPLAQDEVPILRELSTGTRSMRRREDVIIEGRSYKSVFLISDGILMRYRILRDGRRQIVNLIVPGNFAGVPGCLFENALYSIRALTEVQAETIPLQKLMCLSETHPRLASKILWSFACEVALYIEHLVLVGRRTALERVAHFLLELLNRLQVVGLADDFSYHIRLTQEVIGDALGLSLPYVNRILRQLSADGLVTIHESRIKINDIETLSALADFEGDYLRPMPLAEYSDAPP